MAGEGWEWGGGCEGPVCGKNNAWEGGSGGQNTLGEATDLWSRWLELPWVVGGTSGVKGRGRGT